MLKKIACCALLYWFFPLPGYCNWFPELTFTRASPYNYVAKGVMSGMGYSNDLLTHCPYYSALISNQAFPENQEGRYCGILLNLSQRFSSLGGDRWQGLGNVQSENIQVLQRTLYENNIRTVGGLIKWAVEHGQATDQLRVREPQYNYNPNELCLQAQLYQGATTIVPGPTDSSCYRGQVINPSCDVEGDIYIDYGAVGSNKITDGVESRSVNVNLRCEADAKVLFRTNVVNEIELNTRGGKGSVKARLYLNGRTLMYGDGVSISAKRGITPMVLRSDLVGTGNVSGDFFASAVLVVGML
ncbi:TPA: hypothetical protein ACXIY6_004354 [Serratia marcescens]